jgi:hypothetical protein
MRIAIIALLLSGCVEDDGPTLFNGTYSGQSSYAATVTGNAQGFAGAAPLTVVDDGDETMALGTSCTLLFDNVRVATDSRGTATSATAALSGQACTIGVEGGTATFVASGSATSTGGTSLVVSVGGNVTTWIGAPASGDLTVMFQGTWN